MTERCSSLVHVASEAAIFTLLPRHRVAFLHLTNTCRPLFKQWVSLLSTYKTIELCFECFRTFKVFIWLSLVVENNGPLKCYSLAATSPSNPALPVPTAGTEHVLWTLQDSFDEKRSQWSNALRCDSIKLHSRWETVLRIRLPNLLTPNDP